MDNEGEEDFLSFRDHVVLGRALRDETLESFGHEVSSELTVGLESASSLIMEPEPHTLTFSPTGDYKRSRLDVRGPRIGNIQGLQAQSAATRVVKVQNDTTASNLLPFDYDELQLPQSESIPHQAEASQPIRNQRGTRGCKESAILKGHVNEGVNPLSSTFLPIATVPSVHHESQESWGSPSSPTSPSFSDDDKFSECDFGQDYFWDFCSEDEDTSAPCTMDVPDEESPQLTENECSEEEYSATNRDATTETVKDVPLYNGSQITQRESLTTILSFVQSEHISGAGFGRLLSLINLHLPKPNSFLKTNFRLWKVLEGVNEPVQMHYFCSVCYKIRKHSADICDSCRDDNKSVLFFITFPLVPQLQKMWARSDFVEDLKYKEGRCKKNLNNIEDIYDGEVYREAERQFQEHGTNITLMWNTDGIQIFNSNSFSLWPFYLVINELAPNKRFLSENVLIAGLWGSLVKPHPNVYLLPIYKDLQTLKAGIEMKCKGSEETCKVFAQVICGSCDAPARASFMNMKQHSGFYSCPCCLIKGAKPGDATVFPYAEELPPRNLTQYSEHVKWAVENKVVVIKTPRNEDKWCGIKGPTVLSSIVPNIFSSMAIDSMHCIYLGGMRQMLHLWCDKDNKDQPFSIFNKLKTVNERLRKLSPPHFLQRSPQSIDKLIYWKATELRSFLFNLALPLLHDVLPAEYYNHLSLFVKGVALLNSSSISEEDLIFSNLLLHNFVSQFSTLYGADNMSHNIHMLLHLEQCVRSLGPLWSVSCFPFEDLNGRLTNFVHGTRHVGLQIHSNMSIITKLPLMIRDLKGAEAREFCNNIVKKRYRLKIKEKICPGLYCVGVLKGANTTNSWVETVLAERVVFDQPFSVQFYCRLLKQNMLYVSKSYTRGQRVSSYVKYVKNNCSLYGNIEFFVRVSCKCANPCSCETKHFAVIKRKQVSSLEIQGIEMSHIFSLQCNDNCRDVNSYDIVHVCDLITVMFKVNVVGTMYLCEPVNQFELE